MEMGISIINYDMNRAETAAMVAKIVMDALQLYPDMGLTVEDAIIWNDEGRKIRTKVADFTGLLRTVAGCRSQNLTHFIGYDDDNEIIAVVIFPTDSQFLNQAMP